MYALGVKKKIIIATIIFILTEYIHECRDKIGINNYVNAIIFIGVNNRMNIVDQIYNDVWRGQLLPTRWILVTSEKRYRHFEASNFSNCLTHARIFSFFSSRKSQRDGAIGRSTRAEILCTSYKKFAAKYRAFNCNYNRRSSSKRSFSLVEEINWISCCYLFWSAEYAQELPWIIEYHGKRETGGTGRDRKTRSGHRGWGGWLELM